MPDAFPYEPPLPIGSIGTRASGLWGAVFLILSEASLFAYLFFAYFYFAVQPHAGSWPPSGPPSFNYAGPQTAVMLLSSGTAWWANRAAAAGARPRLLLALGLSLLLGIGFLALQLLDWYDKPFSLATDAYSSLYFTIGGVHMAHAVVGVLIFAAALLWSTLGYLGPVRHVPVTVAAVYWYFVAIVWLALFFVLYVTPYLS